MLSHRHIRRLIAHRGDIYLYRYDGGVGSGTSGTTDGNGNDCATTGGKAWDRAIPSQCFN